MNEPEKPASNRTQPGRQNDTGPNLQLFYGLIALALAAAIAIAMMIVFPFYRRR
jgi:hypothetical protein